MIESIAYISLITIFLALSGIHFSWAIGGTLGYEASIPTKEDGTKVFNPKKIDTR